MNYKKDLVFLNSILIFSLCLTSFFCFETIKEVDGNDSQNNNINLKTSDVETGDYHWVYNTSWDASSNDWALDMALDDNNNVYITGRTEGATQDALIAKFDANGQEVWNTTFDGGDYDRGYGITSDDSDNIYIAGQTVNTSDSNYNAFIAKYDSSGNYLWNVTWDGISGSSDSAQDIMLDASGNIYIAGKTRNTEDDLFIAKFDISQNLVWNTTWDSGFNERVFGMALDDSHNIYVTGELWTSQADILVAKFNSTGHEEWNITLDSGYGNEIGKRIVLDDTKNICIAGYFKNSSGLDQFLVAKFDNAGNQEWNHTWDGGRGSDQALDLTIDDLNNIYAVGATDLNSEVIIKKIDDQGTEKWNITYNGEWSDIQGNAITLDDAENIYIAGDYNKQQDAFIAKYQEIILDENPLNEENPDDDAATGDITPTNAAAIPGYSLTVLISAVSISLIVILIKSIKMLKVNR